MLQTTRDRVPGPRSARGCEQRGTAHPRRTEAAGTSGVAAPPRGRGAVGRPDRRRVVGREPAAHGDARRCRTSSRNCASSSGRTCWSREPPATCCTSQPEQLDLTRFEQLVAEARRAEPDERVRLLREALALWRGPPLADFAYEAFAQGEIQRLEELRLDALEQRFDADLVAGAGSGARRRARAARRAIPAPRAAARPSDARALPLGSAGRSTQRVPRGTRCARRRARHRAEPRAAAAVRVDPAPGGRPRSVGGAAAAGRPARRDPQGRDRRSARPRPRAARTRVGGGRCRRCAAGP